MNDLLDLPGGMSFTVDRSHVGWLTFDQKDSPNLLSSEVLRAFDGLLAQLESRIANGQIHALGIHSAKPDTFIA